LGYSVIDEKEQVGMKEKASGITNKESRSAGLNSVSLGIEEGAYAKMGSV
jgi:hypothetical protein